MYIGLMKQAIESFFDFNFLVAGGIGLGIFCVYLSLLWWKRKQQNGSIVWKEIACGIVLSVYLTLVLTSTLLNRLPDPVHAAEVIPFWSYYKVITTKNVVLFWQILYNIFLFLPWGVLIPTVWKVMRKSIWVVGSAFVTSAIIELIQLVFRLGFFEFDDIFHNTLGALLGYGIWNIIQKYRKRTHE